MFGAADLLFTIWQNYVIILLGNYLCVWLYGGQQDLVPKRTGREVKTMSRISPELKQPPRFATDASGKPTVVTLDTVAYITLLVRANAIDPVRAILPGTHYNLSEAINIPMRLGLGKRNLECARTFSMRWIL